jgi:hypothetical protein
MAKDDFVKVSCFGLSGFYSLKLKGPLCIILIALNELNAGVEYDVSSQVEVIDIVLHELLELSSTEVRRIFYGIVSGMPARLRVKNALSGIGKSVNPQVYLLIFARVSYFAFPSADFAADGEKWLSPFRAVVHP